MGLLNKIGEVIINHLTTEQSFIDGQDFEDYILKYLFPQKDYILVEKTHNYDTNKERFVEASLKPDFKFRDKKTSQEFYIEAKYRSKEYSGKIIWCNDIQLKRYHEINKITPTFLLLGDNGTPKNPENLSLIPITQAKYTGLFTSFIDKYAIENKQPVTSQTLWKK